MTASERRFPDFLLIGAPKAGTTAFHRALRRHPRLFLTAPKEPTFFSFAGAAPRFAGPGGEMYARAYIHDERAYRGLFAACPPDAVAGEASVMYLTCERAPVAAAGSVPDAKLIAILRHPVDRAYSNYLHLVRDGNEPCPDFQSAWNADERRHAEGWAPGTCYRRLGCYAAGLSRWLEHYPRERLLVLWYEDWCARPAEVLRETCRFLGVDPMGEPILERDTVSARQPRWSWLQRRMAADSQVRRWAQRVLPLALRDAITAPIRALNQRPVPPLDPQIRARMAAAYRDDLNQLEALTGRDLSAWKS